MEMAAGTHRAEREPLLRATGENSTGELAAATTARFFLPPGRERGLGAALPRFLRADPPGVRGEAGAEGNMAGERGAVPARSSRRAPADCVTAGRGAAQPLPGSGGDPALGGPLGWWDPGRAVVPALLEERRGGKPPSQTHRSCPRLQQALAKSCAVSP